MPNTQNGTRSTTCTRLATLAVLLLGFVAGKLSDRPAESLAQNNTPNREADPKARKAFLSGSERSIIVLKEISTTLTQIDKRVANIEKQLERMEKK